MSNEIISLLSEATDAINASKFDDALSKARAVLIIDPDHKEAKLIEAVALSQLGNRSEASQAFVQAVNINPTDAKVRYNAAVHEFNSGNAETARILCNQALELEPQHAGAMDLLSRMPQAVDVQNGFSGYAREAASQFETAPAGLPFITKLGSTWTVIGWLLTALALGLFVWSLAIMLPNMTELIKVSQSGDEAKINDLASKFQNPLLQILGYAANFGVIIYMILDLVHRRGSMVWLIAHIPCSCCGLGFVTLPIYLLTGRK